MEDNPIVEVSKFDQDVEKHFRAMDVIHKLSGEADSCSFDEFELERIASSITFLSEWRYFSYNPRSIHFVPETEFPNSGEAHTEIKLSQFSSSSVPKSHKMTEDKPGVQMTTEPRKDFILYVGGLVWALDWCPRLDQGIVSDMNCEFIAVAAHPPESSYHKLGARLNGRGMIQIWCLLTSTSSREDEQGLIRIPKRKYKKSTVANEENTPKKPRGRPRKNPIEKVVDVADPQGDLTQALVIRDPESTSDLLSVYENMPSTSQSIPILLEREQKSRKSGASKEEIKHKKPRGKTRKNLLDNMRSDNHVDQFNEVGTSALILVDENPAPRIKKKEKKKAVMKEKNVVENLCDVSSSKEQYFQALAVEFPENMSPRENLLSIPTLEESHGNGEVVNKRETGSDLECTISDLRRKSRKNWKRKHRKGKVKVKNATQNEVDPVPEVTLDNDYCLDLDSRDGCLSKDIMLPRVVFGLGHDGKVAWDVKWRPIHNGESVNKHRMGFLGVTLGNGSIEVWEIPSPQIIKCIYPSRQAKGTDPRFAKLKPVFRCSTLKCGARQSMPLTMEWSLHSPHDLILGGCHDGVVAVWKFSTDCSSEEVKPIICFSAETVPIRALSWAPFEGDSESTNVIVTAGHGGLKFWDLRDPFRPLWDANPSQHFVYSLHWLPDPRCIMVSYDDGTLRMLILSRAAYDAPVTGEHYSGTMQQGLHSFYCSSSAIWSIHVSRQTGMVAYCGADGTVLYFQLTHRAVEKDPVRNRAPHFLCCSLADEGSAVAINCDLPNSPHLMKKSATEWTSTPRSARTVISGLNQAKRKVLEKKPKSEDGVLVLSYGDDDPKNTSTNGTPKSSKSTEGKLNGQQENNDQALVCVDEDGVKTNGKDPKESADNEIESLPSKLVSMYKVRWNMNKGSERWLCYGGAAGIVRCQEIISPIVDKKPLKTLKSLNS